MGYRAAKRACLLRTNQISLLRLCSAFVTKVEVVTKPRLLLRQSMRGDIPVRLQSAPPKTPHEDPAPMR